MNWKRFAVALVALAIRSHVAGSQLLPRDVALTLRKLEVASGKEIWSATIHAELDPLTMEVFDQRVVVNCRKTSTRALPGEQGPPNTEVLFFDSLSGATAAAFDTRDFVRTREDPLRARSSMTSGPALDVRNEVRLENGWISYGLGRMNLEGSRRIHFFQETGTSSDYDGGRDWRIRWTYEFPDYVGSDNISAWRNLLLFRKHAADGKTSVATLVAVPAGSQEPVWQFVLPKEIPTVVYALVVYPGQPHPSRVFSYSVGRADLFVFGNGVLLALDPATGNVRWKQEIANSDEIRRLRIPFLHGYAREASDSGDIVLATERLQPPNVLAVVPRDGGGEVRVLRQDLNDSQLIVVYEGFVYCLTEVLLPAKGPSASP